MNPPRLENRLPPENLLERDDHPLRELAWLLAASLVGLALLVLATGVAARWLAPRLPFEHEVALAEQLFDRPLQQAPGDHPGGAADPAAAARRQALQALAERVAATMDLPPGMQVRVTDLAVDEVNAYATVGGRIQVMHGLLRKLDSEQALAALLAHEIAHVKHRHVAAAMGHGLAVTLVLAMVSPEGAAQAAQGLLGHAAQWALLGYSRAAEQQADTEAMAASLALYGHAGGLATLFAALPQTDAPAGTAWLRTHPDTAERLALLRSAAAARGAAMAGPTTPLAHALRQLPAPRRPPG